MQFIIVLLFSSPAVAPAPAAAAAAVASVFCLTKKRRGRERGKEGRKARACLTPQTVRAHAHSRCRSPSERESVDRIRQEIGRRKKGCNTSRFPALDLPPQLLTHSFSTSLSLSLAFSRKTAETFQREMKGTMIAFPRPSLSLSPGVSSRAEQRRASG